MLASIKTWLCARVEGAVAAAAAYVASKFGIVEQLAGLAWNVLPF